MPLDQPNFPGERLLVLTGAGRTLTSAFAATPEAALDDDPATAAVWGEEIIASVPFDYVFLVDRSGSMEEAFGVGTRMEAVITALLAARATLAARVPQSQSRIGIVSFGGGGIAYGNLDAQVESGITGDFAGLTEIISSFVPVGQTPTKEGLLAARALLEARTPGTDSANLPVLVLLSDGDPDDASGARTAATSLKTAHPTWKLFAVGIDDDGDNAFMEYVGQTVGDGYFAAASPASLTGFLISLVTVLA